MLRITVPSKTLRWWVIGIAIAAVIVSAITVFVAAAVGPDAGVLTRAARFARFWLYVNNERNLTAWYSTVLVAVIALAASDVARLERRLRRSPWWAWAAVTGVFLYLSLDELLSMHDRSSFLSAILLPLTVVFGIVSLPLLWRLPRRIALQLVIAGVVFAVGSAGFEWLGEEFADAALLFIHLEEASEMIGAGLMLAAVAQYRELLDRAPVPAAA